MLSIPNVPVEDVINRCADLLYSGKYPKPPVGKTTFIELAKFVTVMYSYLPIKDITNKQTV